MVGAFPELEEEVRFHEIKKMSRSISSRCQCRLYYSPRAVVGKSLTTSWQTFDWSNWSPLPPSCDIHILLCLFVCLSPMQSESQVGARCRDSDKERTLTHRELPTCRCNAWQCNAMLPTCRYNAWQCNAMMPTCCCNAWQCNALLPTCC